MSESLSDTFRWQTFFQHAAQPIFLVNRRRRLLFVNRAWESCTGLPLADVRGRACRRRGMAAALERDEAILRACAPPVDALRGSSCQVRRRAPGGSNWWEIQFVPLAGSQDLLGILGMIRVLAAPAETPFALPEQLMALRDLQATRYRLDDLDADSPAMKRLLEQAKLASQTQVPITLIGEPGIGKAWLARAIHLHSDRRQRFFITLDAERLPAALIGEILFGPRCMQLAPGTVYLREPGLLPREWQSRLAEAIAPNENAEFPRLMVGLGRDPREEIRAGRLLEEFACAAGTITLAIPPLRERQAELPRFIDKLLERERHFQPHGIVGVGAEAMSVLRAYAWPENLRELQEVLRGCCHRVPGERIDLADLPFYLKHSALPPERRLPLDTLLEQVERRLITLAMKLTRNNQTRAAELLGIWRPRLVRRLEKFGLASTESPEEHDKPTGEPGEGSGAAE